MHKWALIIQHTSYCKRTQHLTPLFSDSDSTELAAPTPEEAMLPLTAHAHGTASYQKCIAPWPTFQRLNRRKRCLA
jgi:hypothetical protein